MTRIALQLSAEPATDIGDEVRFTALLSRHAPSLRRLCASYAHDAAEQEDLMQEIAFALWRALRSFRGECSERTFVYRVAHNRALSFRFRAKLPSVPLDEVPSVADPGAPPDEAAERALEHERLRQAVRALPHSLRDVVILRLEGLSDREMSAVLGISEGNAAVRLSRARKALRQALGAGDPSGVSPGVSTAVPSKPSMPTVERTDDGTR